MKKYNIMKSLLSLILSVSMILTGLGLTVHASTVNAVSDLPDTEASIGEPAPGEPEGTATSPGETGNELPAGTNEPVSSEPEPGEQEGEFTDGEKDSDPGAIDGAKKESGGLTAGPLMLPGFEVSGRDIGLFSAITDNLISDFELTIISDDSTVVVKDKDDDDYQDHEFDVEKLNSIKPL
ncbi:MAG TPA: hypothetical protein GXZ59_07335 [Clostridiaceae bacterium]|nr:hypothetical protein [Clostridiaceae bacterium]